MSPIEVGSDATKQFSDAMKQYAGVDGIPTWGEYIGWLTTDLMIYGLEQAGPDASSQQFITKLRASTWDGAGMSTPTNFADIKPAMGGQDQGNCLYFATFNGTAFDVENGAKPVCGSIIDGITIKAP